MALGCAPARSRGLAAGRRSRRPACSCCGWSSRSRADRPITYADIEEHFKYGSIGSEPGGSLLSPVGGVLPPYWVFKALPSVCSDKLPGGYASSASSWSRARTCRSASRGGGGSASIRSGSTARVCHTSTVRDAPGAAPRVVLGMPAQQLDLQAFVQFVLDCTLDNRLTADAVRGRLPESRRAVALRAAAAPDRPRRSPEDADARPAQSHGADPRERDAALGPRPRRHVQSVQGHPVQLGSEPGCRRTSCIGASDFPSLWNQKPREGHAPALGRRQRLGGRAQPECGAGRRRHAGHRRSRQPEARARLDLDAAAAGLSVPDRQGAGRSRRRRSTSSTARDCHADTASATASRPARASARSSRSTPSAPTAIGSIRTRSRSRRISTACTRIRRTGSRISGRPTATPIIRSTASGCAARSCTTDRCRRCAICSTRPEQRPPSFYRGYDVFDQAKVGFVSDVPAADGQTFTRYDTTRAGQRQSAATSTARRCPTRRSARSSST